MYENIETVKESSALQPLNVPKIFLPNHLILHFQLVLFNAVITLVE